MTFDLTQPHKMIDGNPIVLTAEEIAEQKLLATIWNNCASKRTALHQIQAIESLMTLRRLREAVLGIDNGWLVNINNQISILRGSL